MQKNRYLRINHYYVPPVARFQFRQHELPRYQNAEYYQIGGRPLVLMRRRRGDDNPFCARINGIDIEQLYRQQRPRRMFDKLKKPVDYLRVDCRFYSCPDLRALAALDERADELGIDFLAERAVRRLNITAAQVELIRYILRQTGRVDPFKFMISCLCFNYEFDMRNRLHLGQYVICVQKYWRMATQRRKFLRLKRSSIVIQKIAKRDWR